MQHHENDAILCDITKILLLNSDFLTKASGGKTQLVAAWFLMLVKSITTTNPSSQHNSLVFLAKKWIT